MIDLPPRNTPPRRGGALTAISIAEGKNQGQPSFTYGLLFSLIAVGLPLAYLLLISPSQRLTDPGNLGVSITVLVYSGVRLGMILGRGEPRLIVTITWFFVYISMGIVPLAQINTGKFGLLMDSSLLAEGQMICLVAMLSFDVGSSVKLRQRSRGGFRTLSLARLKVLTCASIVLTAYYVVTLGGPAQFFASRRDLGEDFVAVGLRDGSQVGSALILTLGTIPIFISLLSWTLAVARGSALRRAAGPWLWIAILLGMNVVVNNPISNARYWMLTVILGILFARPKLSATGFRSAITVGLIAALVAFPYSDYFRATAEDRRAIAFAPIEQTISTKDYDQVSMTANGVWWVDQGGHTFGRQLGGALLFFVPRQLWPDKAQDTGVAIATAMSTANVNLSSPLWIEIWVDFSWPGVVVGFFLLGGLANRLDRRFIAARDPTRFWVYGVDILVPVLAGYSLILLRGPLLQSMSRLSILLLTIWILFPRGDREPRQQHHAG
jgi:hypothetical protein